jgi:hypothetical protein
MSQCFWPENEPRIHAMIVGITPPFDAGRLVEMKLSINNRSEVHGEITLRVSAMQARNYKIGDVYAAHFKLVSGMGAG